MDSPNNSIVIPKQVENVGTHFSPVDVHESPVSKMAQRGNLTGNIRKVRDSVAELHNFIQDWNRELVEGANILTSIADLKIEALSRNKDDDSSNVHPQGLQELCDKLDKVCISLASILERMSVIVQQMKAMTKLDRYQRSLGTPRGRRNPREEEEAVMFLTWPVKRFGEVCDDIVKSYSTEMEVKFCICQNIAHCRDKNTIMFHLAAWAHQPYVDDLITLKLESMLKETGFR